MSDYPEHHKVNKHRDQIDAITEFLEYSEYDLVEWQGRNMSLVEEGPRDVVMKFFGIDPEKLEKERREILDEFVRDKESTGT